MTHFMKIHIPSGSFRTSNKSNVLFQSHLGTCVGIALFDYSAHVGGMIHILLPEPVETVSPENSQKYASTGLPMLLEEMYAMGAKPSSLVATVAGGALVAPLSHQDINLDIGGRSAEIAKKILSREGITIQQSETGGFFTCTLELDLRDGKITIQPAWEHTTEVNINIEPGHIPKDELDRTIASLMPIPQTALKILRIVQQDNYNLDAVSRELQKDQVLSARTIQMCNSVMFAGKIKIDTIKDALLILGEGTLINSVVTAAIKSYFTQRSEINGYSLCKGGMFFHSVGCAVITEIIANMSGTANPKIAYTAGLLHDIGKVVLDQNIARLHPLFFRELYRKKTDFFTIENKILGTNHCEIGAILAHNWSFSDSLSDVIRFHHEPQKSDLKSLELVSLVYVADLLMSRFNTGFEIDKLNSENLEEILTNIDMSISDLPEIIDAIPLHIFNLNKFE